MSTLEAAAFIVSVLGVWLTTARSLWNYPFSLLSVVLYGVVFYQVKLYADMGLQGIFACTLLYGLSQWLRGRSAFGIVGAAGMTATMARTIFVALLVLQWPRRHGRCRPHWPGAGRPAGRLRGGERAREPEPPQGSPAGDPRRGPQGNLSRPRSPRTDRPLAASRAPAGEVLRGILGGGEVGGEGATAR